MEIPFLFVLKSACQCLVSQARSCAGNEIALQDGVVNDAKFLSEELEEMRKFLVNVERDEAIGEVMEPGSSDDGQEERGWVDKIRDMASDIEDCLWDLGRHRVEGLPLRNLRWPTLKSRHKVAAELKDLVSRVSLLSERKERYKRAGGRVMGKLAVWKEEARPVDIDWRVDLGQLLARPDESLVVIAVWLMIDPATAAGGARAASLIGEIFDDAQRFECRAWVTATHPVSVTEFLRALVRQFLANDSAPPSLGAIGDTETMGMEELMKAAASHLGEKRYLVVVEDVCTRPIWDWIKLFFQDHRNGSRLIVTSSRADVARHCAGRPTRSFMLERVPDDDARVYVSSDRGATTNGINVVIQIQPYSEFIGRRKDVAELTRWITENVTEPWPISVYGASGIGKSTLVRKVVYESPGVSSKIQRRAWITMVRPFNQQDFLRSVISQFQACSSSRRSKESKINIQNMSDAELVTKIFQLMEGGGRSLVIIDGLSAQEEWDQVKSCLWNDGDVGATCTVIITTTNDAAAHHCSGNKNNVYRLSPLDSAAVRRLFYQKIPSLLQGCIWQSWTLGTLPRWIKTLHNLHKLCLRATLLNGDSVQIITKLPNLIVLRLLAKALVLEAMEFGSDAFPKLELLQIDGLENLMSLSFQRGAAPNLEILQVDNCKMGSEDGLRKFYDLPRIKMVSLDGVLVQKPQRVSGWRKLYLALRKQEEVRRIRDQAHVI